MSNGPIPTVLIIESRFYEDITDQLVSGAVQAITAVGYNFRRLEVPGILEIPAAMRYVVRSQELRSTPLRVDGFVTLGCAIKGGTDHYDHVCREAMRGVQDMALQYTLAVGNGILSVHTLAQAEERAGVDRRNFGGQVARACLRMMALKHELGL